MMDAILSKYYSLTPKQKKIVAEKFLEVLNENEETRKKSGKKSASKFKKITKLETEKDNELYNRLRAWRNKTAEESGLIVKTEAWQIMKNEPLMNIAYYKPVNKEEFLRIDGMTDTMFDSYGEEILGIVNGKNVFVKQRESTNSSVKQRALEEESMEIEDAELPVAQPKKWFL